MVARTLIQRILIDGAVMTAMFVPVAVLILAANPRMALSDYPLEVKAAVPPRTRQEFRQALVYSLPLFGGLIAWPLVSAHRAAALNGPLTYGQFFLLIFGQIMIVFLVDLIVLDILMFSIWTPGFVVIPGTEGMAGYKDVSIHLKGHARGLLLVAVWAAVWALIPTFVF